ncbi:hypothetical protein [Mycobacterium alsense]|uniref:hypothetical protein n=1 Tax=Mycobacterium alsense TaxID=324058 RepID=UPI001041FF36|nr:hypothetical protein [Mycobacterium alsense]
MRAIGGWLFDQRLAGWRTTVASTDHADDRALRILGAAVIELDPALAAEGHHGHPHTLAVCANLFRRDTRVRQAVLKTIDNGSTHVMMWAGGRPFEFRGSARPVEHRLTIAARAFKKEALATARASSDDMGCAETLFALGSGVPIGQFSAREDDLPPFGRSHDDAGGALDRLDRGGEVGIGSQFANCVLP